MKLIFALHWLYHKIFKCVGVRQDENGVISVVNEDAKWILVSMDQKAHKSNEQTIWYIINNSILLMGEGGHDY